VDLRVELSTSRRTQRFDQVVRDLDLVLDTVGGDTLRRSLEVLRPGGMVVTARWLG
jgi:NADPH:quinone reductase-like Zn-dependent oxidoreductase